MTEKKNEIWQWFVAVFFTAVGFCAMVLWVGALVLFITGRIG